MSMFSAQWGGLWHHIWTRLVTCLVTAAIAAMLYVMNTFVEQCVCVGGLCIAMFGHD